MTIWTDSQGSDTNSAGYDTFGPGLSRLRFTEGSGFVHANCPNEPDTKQNGAQDATTMTHEFAHISTPRLHNRRPGNWCGMATCPMPTGAGKSHDFADAWAKVRLHSLHVGVFKQECRWRECKSELHRRPQRGW